MEPQQEDDAPKAETVAVAAAPQVTTEEDKSDDAEALRTLRIAFVGNVDSGKSSLIGKLPAVSLESLLLGLMETARK